MPNPEGTPIWYELITADPLASKKFYDHVIGWTVDPEPMSPEMDYRGIAVDGGGMVGGVMRLSDDMAANGGKPTWLFYIGVDDVDASVEKVKANGGAVHMPAWDIPGVGRIAMVADPQGIPFYVMRGASDQSSTAFERTGMGKCNWNELNTPDQAGANKFYADTFGWTYPDKMGMHGEMGDYWLPGPTAPNTTPWRSVATMMRSPPGTSIGPASTVPPDSPTFFAVSSISGVRK